MCHLAFAAFHSSAINNQQHSLNAARPVPLLYASNSSMTVRQHPKPASRVDVGVVQHKAACLLTFLPKAASKYFHDSTVYGVEYDAG